MINDPGKHSVKTRLLVTIWPVLGVRGLWRDMKALAEQINDLDGTETYGRVVGVRGLMVELRADARHVGRLTGVIETGGGADPLRGRGFFRRHALPMPFAPLDGVRRGCRAVVTRRRDCAALERLARPRGQRLGPAHRRDGAVIVGASPFPFRSTPPLAHARRRVGEPLDLGVRALNTFFTVCRGQRMGIFSGSGVGKSVLLSMLARNVAADFGDWADRRTRPRSAGILAGRSRRPAGLARSVVVVSTSDGPALMRRQAAYFTLAIAEYFRDVGKDVLVLMDLVTRFAMAQREIGLSAGEPPTAKAIRRRFSPNCPAFGAGRAGHRAGYHHRHLSRFWWMATITTSRLRTRYEAFSTATS